MHRGGVDPNNRKNNMKSLQLINGLKNLNDE